MCVEDAMHSVLITFVYINYVSDTPTLAHLPVKHMLGVWWDVLFMVSGVYPFMCYHISLRVSCAGLAWPR